MPVLIMEKDNNNSLADDAALMTLDQLAAYLQVDPQTVMRLARDGKIPCHRVGRQFRFLRSAVLQSLLQKSSDISITDVPIPKPVVIITRRRRFGPKA